MTVRELHGWAPAQVTRDVDGRVLSVTTVEPRFTPQEVAILLASRRRDRVPRGPHGLPLSVSTDPKNKGRFRVEPITDFATEQINRVQDSWRKNYGDVMDVDAMIWPVELID